MIIPGTAKQEEITSIVNSKRGPIAEEEAKQLNHQDFFSNYTEEYSKTSRLWHYLALSFETIIFVGLFIYLFSYRAVFQSIVMPAMGLSVIFIVLLIMHLLTLKKIKDYQ